MLSDDPNRKLNKYKLHFLLRKHIFSFFFKFYVPLIKSFRGCENGKLL